MTFQSPLPAPGWYTNAAGQQQWWDGAQWGQVAGQSAVVPAAAYMPPAPTGDVQPGYVQPVIVQPARSTGVAYLFWFLLGGFAAHRFYLGRIGSAVTFLVIWWIGWLTTVFTLGWVLVTAGAIWLFVDLFLIPQIVREENARLYAAATSAMQPQPRPPGTY